MNWTWLDTTEDHQRWGVTVKPSQLLNHKELGLYATQPFLVNQKIAPYLGEALTSAQRIERYGHQWGSYVYFKPWGHPSIDALFYRGAAAFANDGSWLLRPDGHYLKREPDLSNVILSRGWLKASRPISQGEELLLNYGESYWKHRFTGQVSPPHGASPTLVTVRELDPQVGGGIEGDLGQCHDQLTPVEFRDDCWFKRDDLFTEYGVHGGKVRSCLAYLATRLKQSPPIVGLISGGSRLSPQVQIVGHIAHHLGLKARLHLPKGQLPPLIRDATLNLGHEVIQWFPGFNHVINARINEDRQVQGNQWIAIPFGMECSEAIECTAKQVANLPFGDPRLKRIVVPVGSGMTLAGLLVGLRRIKQSIPILGVVVGKDPTRVLDHWAPSWRQMVSLVQSAQNYHAPAHLTQISRISLDPIYEAKTLPYLQKGDLLWIVGHR